jgi:hypothetical protein
LHLFDPYKIHFPFLFPFCFFSSHSHYHIPP